MSALPASSGYPAVQDAMAAFERGEIDPDAFDHAAHIHMAWCYMQSADSFAATARFTAALQRLTEKLGATDKYHATVSGFFLHLVDERICRQPAVDWPAFREANPDLFGKAADLLSGYYSKGRLDSSAARRRFLLPDRVPASRSQGAATTW